MINHDYNKEIQFFASIIMKTIADKVIATRDKTIPAKAEINFLSLLFAAQFLPHISLIK